MMLPGVELARRRRLHHHSDSYLRGPLELSSAAQPQPNDQLAAAAARRRLEEKLRRPFVGSRSLSSSPALPSPFTRWMRISPTANAEVDSRPVRAGHESGELSSSRNGGAGKRGGEHGRRSSSRADICAVCLDGFRAQEKVIWLPCAHRYHASCVLPWLADHSHCPYCRTEVPALDWRSESVL